MQELKSAYFLYCRKGKNLDSCQITEGPPHQFCCFFQVFESLLIMPVKLYLGFWYQAFYPGSSNQHLFSSQEPCAKHNFWCRKHQRKLFQRKTCDGECKQELPLGTKRKHEFWKKVCFGYKLHSVGIWKLKKGGDLLSRPAQNKRVHSAVLNHKAPSNPSSWMPKKQPSEYSRKTDDGGRSSGKGAAGLPEWTKSVKVTVFVSKL